MKRAGNVQAAVLDSTAYPSELGDRASQVNVPCRTCPYLNNIVEQDRRAIKRRVNASQGSRSFEGAWRTIQGHEVLHMIRKGQVRWLRKEDVVGQVQFVNETLGLKAA
jgi:transposase-like protein